MGERQRRGRGVTGKKDIKWKQRDPGSAMERGLDPVAGPGLRPVGVGRGVPQGSPSEGRLER